MDNFYLKVYTLWGVLFCMFISAQAQVTVTSNRVCYGLASNLQNSSNIAATSSAEWDLDNDGFFDDASGNNINYTFLTADTFEIKLKVTVSTGVEHFSSSPHLVIVDPLPLISFAVSGVCLGTSTNFINNSSISDGSALSYTWDFTNDGVNDATTANTSFLYPVAASYEVKLTVTSTQNCSASQTNNVAISALPLADFSLTSTCVNSPSLFVNQSVFPGSPAYRIVWNFGDDYLSFNQDSAYHTYSSGDTFFVQLKVIDTSGCVDSITKPIVVESTVNYSVTYSNGTQIYQGQSTTVEVSGDFVSILWDDNTTQNSRSISASGYYAFSVINSSGCSASSGFNINTIPAPDKLEPANDFLTPNADGKNDVLFFENADAFTGCKLTVFDERGLLVFSADDYKNDWDGGASKAGAYYYFLKCNEVPEVKGISNIIR